MRRSIQLWIALAAGTLVPLLAPAKQVPRGRTFVRDVAPILHERCAPCHRPGGVAPMSLLTYAEVRPAIRAIREKVLEREMPPWHAEGPPGTFKHDRRLTRKEVRTIVGWIDAGAREGNPGEMPPPPRYSDDWKIGEPDVVLRMPREYEVPAEGTVTTQYFIVPSGFEEDRWIRAAELRPGDRSAVRQATVFFAAPGKDLQSMRFGLGSRSLEGRLDRLAHWTPGEEPWVLPEGVARLVPAGSFLVFQIHYAPDGNPRRDRTSVGILFSREPVREVLKERAVLNRKFVIPPGAPAHEVRAEYTFRQRARILSLTPHMHLRGKDFTFILVFPGGDSRVLLSVPRYDFNWQTRYELTEPVAVPANSRLVCVAHFDNSAANSSNPDPSRTVRWGQQPWEEMMIGFVSFTQEARDPSLTVVRP